LMSGKAAKPSGMIEVFADAGFCGVASHALQAATA
jgi:hypothetical protein